MIVDADESTIDEISKPYQRYNHENKSSSSRCKCKADIVSNSAVPSFLRSKDEKRLRAAASRNDVEKVNELLEKGVNPNKADSNGRTALHLASCHGYSDVVKSLLAHNADCNVVDKVGNTPLHLAVCTSSRDTVFLLLNAGCCVSKKGNNGCTPLQLAQTKLWFLEKHNCPEYNRFIAEVSEAVEMIKNLLQKESEEAQLMNEFATRLSLSQTKEEVVDDVKQLLENLNSLSINKNLASSG